jgi:hypothetical protein
MYAVFVPPRMVQVSGVFWITIGVVLMAAGVTALGSDRWPFGVGFVAVGCWVPVRGGRQFRSRVEVGSHGILVRRATRWVGFDWHEVAGFLVERYTFSRGMHWHVAVLVPTSGRPVLLLAVAAPRRAEVLPAIARLEAARARATGTAPRRSVEWYGGT